MGLVSAGSAETIDVRKALNFPDYVRLFNLLDPLFFAAPGGLVTPGLCQAAHPNKDATVWTLELRPGVEWQDGSPFTADDVIYTMQASWHSKQSNIFSLADSIIDYTRLRKRDKLTVEVGLKHGVAQFPSTTFTQNSFVIKNGTTDFTKVIGTGPFKLESFTPGTQSVFTANRNYWGAPAPYVDTADHRLELRKRHGPAERPAGGRCRHRPHGRARRWPRPTPPRAGSCWATRRDRRSSRRR